MEWLNSYEITNLAVLVLMFGSSIYGFIIGRLIK